MLSAMETFLLLLPDFSLILLGVVLRRHGGFVDGFWAGLEKLVYFVLFPALLFSALARARIDLETTLPLFAAGALVMGSGFALGLAGRPFMGLSSLAFASRLQCAYRFNTYIGMAVAGKVHGAAGIAAMGVVCGTMVPFANIMAVSMLARHGQGGVWRELARNPLIQATLAGLAFNAAGLTLVAPAQHFLARLADASIALGLIAVGAALRWGACRGQLVRIAVDRAGQADVFAGDRVVCGGVAGVERGAQGCGGAVRCAALGLVSLHSGDAHGR